MRDRDLQALEFDKVLQLLAGGTLSSASREACLALRPQTTTEQVEAVWQAAAVVPKTLLDTDTRAVAARQMFDARRPPELAGAAREATSIVRSAEWLVAGTPYRS